MLELDAVNVSYGAVTAVVDVSLNLQAGQVGALLGANGAGKSSVLGAVSGLVKPDSGSINFLGEDLVGVKGFRRKGRGVAHALEGHRVFGELTVQENLLLGALEPGKRRVDKKVFNEAIAAEFERFPVLGERRKQRAGLLSGGEQQMLTISTALMSRPKLLLLDEPSLGLSPKITGIIFSTIAELARTGLTIVLVEQTVDRALSVADVVWVMRQGRIVRSGTPHEIQTAGDIGELYLGSVQ